MIKPYDPIRYLVKAKGRPYLAKGYFVSTIIPALRKNKNKHLILDSNLNALRVEFVYPDEDDTALDTIRLKDKQFSLIENLQ